MRARGLPLSCCAALGVGVALMLAASPARAAPEREVQADLDVLLAASPGTTSPPRRTSPADLTAEARLSATWLWTLDSGLQPGLMLGARAQARRTDAGAVPSSLPPCTPAACPLPAGPISGTRRGMADADVQAEALLDRAALVVRGGWGEVQLGRTAGAAETVQQTVPGLTALALRGAGTADPLALGQIARPGLSGSAGKISLVSTRIIGLRAALSHAPHTDEGAPDGPPRAVELAGRIGDVWEAGLEGALRVQGLELGIGVSHAQGTLEPAAVSPLGQAGVDLALTSLTVRLDGAGWRTGIGLRSGDQGGALGAYQAAEVTGVVEAWGWSWMAGASLQREPELGVRTHRVSFMAGYPLTDEVQLLAGVASAQRRVSNGLLGAAQTRTEQRSALVMGLSISY
jgi:hypothetical protein